MQIIIELFSPLAFILERKSGQQSHYVNDAKFFLWMNVAACVGLCTELTCTYFYVCQDAVRSIKLSVRQTPDLSV